MLWTVVLEKTFESPLDCKEIKSVHPKGNQSWIFIGRTDAEAEAPILRPPDAKNWLIGKDPDAGKDWRWEEKGMIDRGWDGWMASRIRWTWVWASSESWWWTGKPAVLQSTWGCKELNTSHWTELNWSGRKCNKLLMVSFARWLYFFIFFCIFQIFYSKYILLEWLGRIIYNRNNNCILSHCIYEIPFFTPSQPKSKVYY